MVGWKGKDRNRSTDGGQDIGYKLLGDNTEKIFKDCGQETLD